MSNEFKREERYIVVKIKDAQAIDSNDPFNGYDALRDFLKQWHIPTREAVVVEKDWPEFEPTWAAIERRVTGQVAWSGAFMPPAGAKCEIRNPKAGTAWAESIIHYAARNVVVWEWVGEPSINGLCTSYAHDIEIRPMRTPEQIAEEERSQAIWEMSEIAKAKTGFGVNMADFGALYDAGYRKQVEP